MSGSFARELYMLWEQKSDVCVFWISGCCLIRWSTALVVSSAVAWSVGQREDLLVLEDNELVALFDVCFVCDWLSWFFFSDVAVLLLHLTRVGAWKSWHWIPWFRVTGFGTIGSRVFGCNSPLLAVDANDWGGDVTRLRASGNGMFKVVLRVIICFSWFQVGHSLL